MSVQLEGEQGSFGPIPMDTDRTGKLFNAKAVDTFVRVCPPLGELVQASVNEYALPTIGSPREFCKTRPPFSLSTHTHRSLASPLLPRHRTSLTTWHQHRRKLGKGAAPADRNRLLASPSGVHGEN